MELNHTAGCGHRSQLVAVHCSLNADCSLLLLLVGSLLVGLSPGSLHSDAACMPALLRNHSQGPCNNSIWLCMTPMTLSNEELQILVPSKQRVQYGL